MWKMTFFNLDQGQDLGGTLPPKIPGNTPPPPPLLCRDFKQNITKKYSTTAENVLPGDYSKVTYVRLVNTYGNLINHECTEQVHSDININPHILSIKVTGVCLAFKLA